MLHSTFQKPPDGSLISKESAKAFYEAKGGSIDGRQRKLYMNIDNGISVFLDATSYGTHLLNNNVNDGLFKIEKLFRPEYRNYEGLERASLVGRMYLEISESLHQLAGEGPINPDIPPKETPLVSKAVMHMVLSQAYSLFNPDHKESAHFREELTKAAAVLELPILLDFAAPNIGAVLGDIKILSEQPNQQTL